MNISLEKSLGVLSNATKTLPSPMTAIETVTSALSDDTPENRENVSALAAAAAFGFVYSRMKDKKSVLTLIAAGGAALAGYYGADLLLDAVHKARQNNAEAAEGETEEFEEPVYSDVSEKNK
jgi:hypothetical protein